MDALDTADRCNVETHSNYLKILNAFNVWPGPGGCLFLFLFFSSSHLFVRSFSRINSFEAIKTVFIVWRESVWAFGSRLLFRLRFFPILLRYQRIYISLFVSFCLLTVCGERTVETRIMCVRSAMTASDKIICNCYSCIRHSTSTRSASAWSV